MCNKQVIIDISKPANLELDLSFNLQALFSMIEEVGDFSIITTHGRAYKVEKMEDKTVKICLMGEEHCRRIGRGARGGIIADLLG